MHTGVSGVAHYKMKDDQACLMRIRELISELPYTPPQAIRSTGAAPARPSKELYDMLPEDHRQLYDIRALLDTIIDKGSFDEFQSDYACEMICGTARVDGVAVGIIMNARGMIKVKNGPPRFGGIIYTESAEKTAYFIETMNRHQTPILFIQYFPKTSSNPSCRSSAFAGGADAAGAKVSETRWEATGRIPTGRFNRHSRWVTSWPEMAETTFSN